MLNTYGTEVQEFSATGEYLSGFGSAGPAGAVGIAVSGGNLYVTEGFQGRVQKFSSTGTSLGVFDESGAGAANSNLPTGIATDPVTGNLYVSDIGKSDVQEFSATGSFIAAFGSAGYGAGQFSGAKGVALGPLGQLYIADTGNQRVQEWP